MPEEDDQSETRPPRESVSDPFAYVDLIELLSKPLFIVAIAAFIVSLVAFKFGIDFWSAASLCVAVVVLGGMVVQSDDSAEMALSLGKPLAPVAGAAAVGFWISSALGISFWAALAVAVIVVIGIVILFMFLFSGGG